MPGPGHALCQAGRADDHAGLLSMGIWEWHLWHGHDIMATASLTQAQTPLWFPPLLSPAGPGCWPLASARPWIHGRCHPQAEQPQVLSAADDRMDELGAGIAQSRRTVALIKSAAAAERERVSRLFAEAAATLQGFQAEVRGFIEEGEAAMLAHSQGDLRRQEEQRSRLSRARHNLSQVPEADSVSFLQELLALRLALEEGCGPGPSPPRELSFTKSSQAVQAVRDVLAAACTSQWEQLQGLGSNEDSLQKPGSEADAESQAPDSTNHLESEAPRDYFLKFAYIVDLDSDTADKFLQLFGTKGVKRVLCPINYPESPTRFTHCEQVLGEGALDRGTYYWEVEIIEGWVSMGVMAEDFSPQEPYDRGRLGRNAHSCCLQWNGRSFSIWFHGLEMPLSQPFSPTVGICLEYADRALAFYAVRDGKGSSPTGSSRPSSWRAWMPICRSGPSRSPAYLCSRGGDAGAQTSCCASALAKLTALNPGDVTSLRVTRTHTHTHTHTHTGPHLTLKRPCFWEREPPSWKRSSYPGPSSTRCPAQGPAPPARRGAQ
ncbi:E3 ubiquitin-protein ligase TRIM47 isoform X2 [Tamandua tetradactyla]|uniref:E3 ubiquitin-protein ligase TRIM47 isoform X2 n=1 Tax=Tamandua tetradactyla TaxID=48850 RepID=UPI004053AB5A